LDINKYISSEVLESYVLGLASNTERQEGEKLAAKQPAIKTHLVGIEEALKAFIQCHALASGSESCDIGES
jgi:hypothetical protein